MCLLNWSRHAAQTNRFEVSEVSKSLRLFPSIAPFSSSPVILFDMTEFEVGILNLDVTMHFNTRDTFFS